MSALFQILLSDLALNFPETRCQCLNNILEDPKRTNYSSCFIHIKSEIKGRRVQRNQSTLTMSCQTPVIGKEYCLASESSEVKCPFSLIIDRTSHYLLLVLVSKNKSNFSWRQLGCVFRRLGSTGFKVVLSLITSTYLFYRFIPCFLKLLL